MVYIVHLTLILLIAAMMSNFELGLVISKLPINCTYINVIQFQETIEIHYLAFKPDSMAECIFIVKWQPSILGVINEVVVPVPLTCAKHELTH